MGAGCWAASRALGDLRPLWLAVLVLIGLGFLLYLLACRLLRVRELATALRWLGNPPILQPLAGE